MQCGATCARSWRGTPAQAPPPLDRPVQRRDQTDNKSLCDKPRWLVLNKLDMIDATDNV